MQNELSAVVKTVVKGILNSTVINPTTIRQMSISLTTLNLMFFVKIIKSNEKLLINSSTCVCTSAPTFFVNHHFL